MHQPLTLRPLIFTGLLAGHLISTSVHSATDGSLSNSQSQGDVDITVNVGTVIKISELNNITFGFDASLASPASGTDTFCVYTNAASSNYRVTATSQTGGTSGFSLTDGNSPANLLAYSVTFQDDDSHSERLVSGEQNTTNFTANTESLSCDAGDEATITVAIDKNDAVAVPAGEYTDTLTLLVEPD